MSASRTLLRRHKLAGMKRNDEGEMVKALGAKPGSRERRIVWERPWGPFTLSYHATKGFRCVREGGQ